MDSCLNNIETVHVYNNLYTRVHQLYCNVYVICLGLPYMAWVMGDNYVRVFNVLEGNPFITV